MSTRYAIHIEESNLDLIQILNNGGEVKVEPGPTYFLVDVTSPTTTENHQIKHEAELYDDEGHLVEDVVVLM